MERAQRTNSTKKLPLDQNAGYCPLKYTRGQNRLAWRPKEFQGTLHTNQKRLGQVLLSNMTLDLSRC